MVGRESKRILESKKLLVEIGRMGMLNQRFDHLGYVHQIWEKNSKISYLSEEPRPFPEENKGIGICEEFCASRPIGFDEAQEGDWFIKPGCGILKKKGGKYSFENVYEFKPLEIQEKITEEEICFQTVQEELRGYGYVYEKKFFMAGESLCIQHKMENTGTRVLDWQSYAHNFFLPGAEDCRGFRLHSSYGKTGDWELLSGDDILKKNGEFLEVAAVPQKAPLYILRTEAHGKGGYQYMLMNPEKKRFVTEEGDFVPEKFKVWISRNCFCPEIFLQAKIEPGETFSWERRYSFSDAHV